MRHLRPGEVLFTPVSEPGIGEETLAKLRDQFQKSVDEVLSSWQMPILEAADLAADQWLLLTDAGPKKDKPFVFLRPSAVTAPDPQPAVVKPAWRDQMKALVEALEAGGDNASPGHLHQGTATYCDECRPKVDVDDRRSSR